MLFFDELADWWDGNKKEASVWLEEFVEEHNSWWAIAIAGSVETAMTLGGGFVDLARFGEGIKKGTWGGLGEDALRLLGLAGPLGRGGRYTLSRLVKNVDGEVCTWLSATKALRQTGTKHFALLDDLLHAMGFPRTMATTAIPAVWPSQLFQALRQLGARVRGLATPNTMKGVEQLVKHNPSGVVMFSIKWSHKVFGGPVGHTLIGFRDTLGRFRIADRTGKVVSILDDLAGLYPGIPAAVPTAASFIENAQVVKAVSGLSMIAFEVRAVLLMDRRDADARMTDIRERHSSQRQPTSRPKVSAKHLVAKAKQAGATKSTPAGSSPRPQYRIDLVGGYVGPNEKPAGPPLPDRGGSAGGRGLSRGDFTHVVQQRESWRSIAEKYYTDDQHVGYDQLGNHLALFNAARGVVSSADFTPPVGKTIIIPGDEK